MANHEISSLLDDRLAELVRDGNLEAFSELVIRYQAVVFNTCYRLVSQRGDAEDLTQETFIRAYQRFDTFDIRRPFKPWVLRIAINLCWNFLKSKDSKVNFSYNDDIDSMHYTHKLGPEDIALLRERDQIIYSAIASLPPNYRIVLELKHFQNQSYAEIAKLLGMRLSNVKSNLFRARKLLALKLKDISRQV